jgi:hypothetical protein
MRHSSRGSVIGLTASFTLIIVLVGLALMRICETIGGGRQFVNTVDATALGLAKEMLRVSVPITDPHQWQQFREFTNHPESAEFWPPANTVMDVANFNRAVLETAIVQANASDETANKTAPGITTPIVSADRVADMIDEIGARLKQRLSHLHDEQRATISHTASHNDLTLLRAPGVRLQPLNYQVSYIHATTQDPDSGASNVDAEGLRGLFTATGVHDHTVNYIPLVGRRPSVPAGSRASIFLAGYKPIPRLSDPHRFFTATSLQPFEKPHLISHQNFEQNKTPDTISDLPTALPNSVEISAAAGSLGNLRSSAAAVTSTLDTGKYQWQTNFHLSISNGFIVVDNGHLHSWGMSGIFPPGSSIPQAATIYQHMMAACGYGGLTAPMASMPNVSYVSELPEPPSSPRPVDCLLTWIAQRACEITQIHGDRDGHLMKNQITWLFMTTPLRQGQLLCLYHKRSDRPGVITLGPMPAWIPGGLVADGVGGPEDSASSQFDPLVISTETYAPPAYPFVYSFALSEHRLVVPQAVNDATRRLFGVPPSTSLQGHQGVRWVAGSGWKGYLGYLSFGEWIDHE